MNLGASLQWVAGKLGDKVCLIEDNVKISYRELWQAIEVLAKGFLKIGIKADDNIVLFLPNKIEFIYSFYALARINAVNVPLNTHLTSYELKKIFNDCAPTAIITTSAFYEEKIRGIVNQENIIILIDKPKEGQSGCLTISDLFEIGKDGELPEIKTEKDQAATINYTYRGLGKPLGAVLTHANYHHGAVAYVRLTELMTVQRVLLVTPMAHIFTLVSGVIVSLLRGATVVIMKNFVPKSVFKAIEEHKIDFIIAVPTIYISLLRNYRKTSYNISSLNHGISGGSLLPVEVYKKVKDEMGIELFQGYGLTETVPVTCNPKGKNKPESLGVPGHKMKIKIADTNGREQEAGEIGEILIGGPSVMKGYYKKRAENEKYLKDGWFYTGDMGYKDKEGYLYFTRLKKAIVKVGGNTVDIEEVKEALLLHPDVSKVELEVKESALWGNILSAVIYVKDNKKDVKALRKYYKNRLAEYKMPKRMAVVKG